MADILIHTTVPSLFTQTESASNLMTDISTENSHTNNTYNSHITRLRNSFTEHGTISNDLNSNKNPSNSSLIFDDHSTYNHANKGIFHTLDDKSISHSSTPLATKPMTHNQQEHIRDVPMYMSGTSSQRSLTQMANYHDDVPYAIINRKLSNTDQHNDFPADAIEQHKKQHRDESDRTNLLLKPSSEQKKAYTMPSLVSTNVLKPMDHLNTIFVKPTKIERSLPKLVFQDDQLQEKLKFNENTTANGKQGFNQYKIT